MTGMSAKKNKPSLTARLATGLSAAMLVMILAVISLSWLMQDAPVPEQPVQENKPDAPTQQTMPVMPTSIPVASVAALALPPAPIQNAPATPQPEKPVQQAKPVEQPSIPQQPSKQEIEPLQTSKPALVTTKKPEKKHWEPLGKTAPGKSTLPREQEDVADSAPEQPNMPSKPVDFAALRKNVRDIARSHPVEPARSRPEPAKEQNQQTPPDPAPKVIAADKDRKLERQGRVLLNLLEHGDGPGIHLDWPANRNERDRLYNLLNQCLGMQSVLWAEPAVIYDNNHARGEGQQVDTSRYSLFLRAPIGRLPTDERALLRRIEKRHGTAAAHARPARLFPRKLDAILLGGLQQLAGPAYKQAKTITARYRLQGTEIRLENIRLDNKPVPGNLRLASGPFYHCSQGRI